MKRVAKRVTLSLVESKRFAIINEGYNNILTSAPNQWTIRNIFAPLGQGVTSSAIVGSEIVNPLLKLKFTCKVDFSSLQAGRPKNYGTVAFNVFLVAANEQFRSNTGLPVAYGSLTPDPGWFYQTNANRPTLNGNNVKVLKKWSRRVTPNQVVAGGSQGIVNLNGSMKYRWKRKLTFEDEAGVPSTGGPQSSKILRGWNYYILVGTGVNTDYNDLPVDQYPTVAMDSFLYFKDP